MYDDIPDPFAKPYVVSPESILRRCLLNGLISIDEVNDPTFIEAAQTEADELRDRWPEGEGFGSSDFTFLAQDFLRTAGAKADFVNNRLTRLPA